MKVGDFVRKRTVMPCYGIIIERKPPANRDHAETVWVVHWSSDTSYGYPRAENVWEADIEVINE